MQQRIITFMLVMKELAERHKQPEMARIPEYVNQSVPLLDLMWMDRFERQDTDTSEQIQELASECPAAQNALQRKISELENNGISKSKYHLAACRAPKQQKNHATRNPAAPMRTLNF